MSEINFSMKKLESEKSKNKIKKSGDSQKSLNMKVPFTENIHQNKYFTYLPGSFFPQKSTQILSRISLSLTVHTL